MAARSSEYETLPVASASKMLKASRISSSCQSKSGSAWSLRRREDDGIGVGSRLRGRFFVKTNVSQHSVSPAPFFSSPPQADGDVTRAGEISREL